MIDEAADQAGGVGSQLPLIDHDVDVDAAAGSATVSIPVPLTAGRQGFAPSLALRYASRGSNSPFGVGWALQGLLSIQVNDQHGFAQYDGTGGFTAGGEELVPALVQTAGAWTPRVQEAGDWVIRYYRSRFQTGAPVRFEQWVAKSNGDVHWRARYGDGSIAVLGRGPSTRIADPDDPIRVYAWLIEAQYDAVGSAILYEYAPENEEGVDPVLRRGEASLGQRYLKHVRYGNTAPLSSDAPAAAGNRWLFHVVIDYGDHDEIEPKLGPTEVWPARPDAHSTRRPGFELRTYRLARCILVFHDIPELGSEPLLVSSLALEHDFDVTGSTLHRVIRTGYRYDGGVVRQRSTPPLTLKYTEAEVDRDQLVLDPESARNLPQGLSGSRYRLVDLYGEGLPGVLADEEDGWYYKRNLGGGRFGAQEVVAAKPAGLGPAPYAVGDFDGDGNPNLVVLNGREAGYCEFDREGGTWSALRPFAHAPQIAGSGRLETLDVDGDGQPDLVLTGASGAAVFRALGKDGYGPPVTLTHALATVPSIAERAEVEIFLADMSGDGTPDLVRVAPGCIEYWPNLGGAHFGASVVMDGAPMFDGVFDFDPARVRFADLDGSGTSDLIYLDRAGVRWWINASGNRLVDGGFVASPPIHDPSGVQVLDLLGDGTPCLVWSSWLAQSAGEPVHYLRLTGATHPRLLIAVDNGIGCEVCLEYATSAEDYLRDRDAGRPWRAPPPSHPVVVRRRILHDHVADTRVTTRYEYHDGAYDGQERVFRGFGQVDRYDARAAEASATVPDVDAAAPACMRTWFHTGTLRAGTPCRWIGDAAELLVAASGPEDATALPDDAYVDAYRALAGRPLREELFAVDLAGGRAPHPLSVVQHAHTVRLLQPPARERPAAFLMYERDAIESTYEEESDDPRVLREIAVEIDGYGQVATGATAALPRRQPAEDLQREPVVTAESRIIVNIDEPDLYLLDLAVEETTFELGGVDAGGDLWRHVHAALVAPRPYHEPVSAAAVPEARYTAWTRTRYWDDALTGPLAQGEVGTRGLVHHTEHAVLTPRLVDDAYGGRVDDSLLAGEALLAHADGYWWSRDPVEYHLPPEQFLLTDRIESVDGATEAYAYDPYDMFAVTTTDAAGNVSRREVDYHLLTVWRSTDPNGTVTETRFDPLGIANVTASYGEMPGPDGIALPYGDDPLSSYARLPDPVSVATVIADPAAYLQSAGRFTFAEVDAWDREGRAPTSVVLTREALVHDGQGGTQTGEIAITVTHYDALGNVLQTKKRVDPGLAIRRDADGHLVTDEHGVPQQANADERWLASGHLVVDERGQPARQHAPFFSPNAEYEADPELAALGPVTRWRYDALARLIRQENADGTFTRVTFGAWWRREEDAIDTVDESGYKLQRETLPNSDPEHQALAKAQALAATPTVIQLNPLGRDVVRIEDDGGGTQRQAITRLDHNGDPTEHTDPRGLIVLRLDRDMEGRPIRERSVDSGETLILHDALGNAIRKWDARAVETATTFDALGRLTAVHVTGLGLDQRVERLVYGDDPSVANSALRNLRGRLVEHVDPAGRVTIDHYTPSGAPARTTRRLTTDPTTVPDWGTPDAVALQPVQYATETAYDALDRPVKDTPPDGLVRRVTYRRDGGLARLTVQPSDASSPEREIVRETELDAYGNRTITELGNDVLLDRIYDTHTTRLAVLRARAHRPGEGIRTLQWIVYTRDPLGQITRVEDFAQQPAGGPTPLLHGLTVSSHCDYTYDGLGRLVEATGRVHQALLADDFCSSASGVVKGTRHLTLNNGAAVERYTRTYRYDLAGNIESIRHSGQTQSFTTNLWISPTSNRALPASTTNPESRFDAAGNTIHLPHLAALDWNHNGAIKRAVMIDRSASGQPDDAEYYVYDGNGVRRRRMTHRLVNGTVEVTEKVYLDGCEIVRVLRGDDVLLERFSSHIADDGGVIAIVHRWTTDVHQRETDDVTQQRIHYVLGDHLGSSVLELDEHAGVISYEEMFPFGGSAFIAGDNLRDIQRKDYRYTGKERDDATGLDYFGYRYYAPWIGRWISPDPAGGQDGLNPYEFVRNNPVNYVDPDGLQAIGDEPAILPRLSPGHAYRGHGPRQVTLEAAIEYWNRTYSATFGFRAVALEEREWGWLITAKEPLTHKSHGLPGPLPQNVSVEPSEEPTQDPARLVTRLVGSRSGAGRRQQSGTGQQTPPVRRRQHASGNGQGEAGNQNTGGTESRAGKGPKGQSGPHGAGGGNTPRDPAAGSGGTGTRAGSDGSAEGQVGGGPGGEVGGRTGAQVGGETGGEVGGRTGGELGGRLGGVLVPQPGEGRSTMSTGSGTDPSSLAGAGTGGGDVEAPRGPGFIDSPIGTSTPWPGAGRTADSLAGRGIRRGTPSEHAATGGSVPGIDPRGTGREQTLLGGLTEVAGVLNWELPSDKPGGLPHGIPGGEGRLNPGAIGQAVYIAATIVSTFLLVRDLAKVASKLARVVSRTLRSALRLLWRGATGFFARGGHGVPTGIGRMLLRCFVEDRRRFSMSREFFARWRWLFGQNRAATGAPRWSMEHMWIKQAWYRGASPKFPPGSWQNRMLQMLGDAGWNVVPVPHTLNNGILRNIYVSYTFNAGVVGGGGYGIYRLWAWALSPLSARQSGALPDVTAAVGERPLSADK